MFAVLITTEMTLHELRCETDFLSRSAEFRSLAKELALHIASEAPEYVSVDEVPESVLQAIRLEAETNARLLEKPATAVPKLVAGRISKYTRKACLLEQKYVKNPDALISEMVQTLSAKSGESIRIANFARFEID